MNISTRIEPLSPIGLLDMTESVHVAKLLEACEQPGDSWSSNALHSELDWLRHDCLPEPNTPPKLELPWASDCWGRILYYFYGWDVTTWSIEESGVLVAPIYLDGQQAHLIKATRAPSSATTLVDSWVWVAELKAHCHVLKVCRGTLHVCHADDHDHDAIAMAYEFHFTSQEITHLWELLKSLRKTYRPPKPPNAPDSSGRP